MGKTLIEKKLLELKEEEKRINDYFDVTKRHKKQHPWIDDMRDDFKSDLQNFGMFSRIKQLFRGTISEEQGNRTYWKMKKTPRSLSEEKL